MRPVRSTTGTSARAEGYDEKNSDVALAGRPGTNLKNYQPLALRRTSRAGAQRAHGFGLRLLATFCPVPPQATASCPQPAAMSIPRRWRTVLGRSYSARIA